MLLFDPEDYTAAQWYGTGNIEVNCTTWEDGFTTSRATSDAYFKAFIELLTINPIQISEAEAEVKDDLKNITDEIWANWKIYLEKRTAFWYSLACRCGEVKELVQDEEQRETIEALCKALAALEADLAQVEEDILNTENDPNLSPEEKAKMLAELEATKQKLEADILNTTSSMNAILELAITKITLEFRNVDWVIRDYGVDETIENAGKWWMLNDTTTTWDLDLNSIGEGAIIEDGRLKFQEVYWNEYEQSIKNVSFSIKKWFSRVWALKIGEGDFTPAPPINGFSNPAIVRTEIPMLGRENLA